MINKDTTNGASDIMPRNKCRTYHRLLSKWAYSRSDQNKEYRKFQEHLSTCAECAQWMRAMADFTNQPLAPKYAEWA